MKLALRVQTAAILLFVFYGLSHAASQQGYPNPAQTFSLQNQTLNYHPLGEGHHTVLLLGGGPGFSSWNLTPVQQHLAKNYRVLLMDMRGTGENRTPLENLDRLLDQWVEDIEALRRHEQAGQLILIGHSWGALMAQYYAREHPTRIARLVVLNPVDPDRLAMRNLVQRIDARRQQAGLVDEHDPWDLPAPLDPKALVQQQLDQVLPTYFHSIEQGQNYARHFGVNDFSLEINHAIWPQYQANPIDAEFLQTLAKRRAIEFISCQQDLLMPEALQGYQQILPAMSFQVLEQCAHFPWEETPGPFFTALDQAMTSQPPEDDFSDLSEADRAWLMDDSGLDLLLDALAATESNARFIEPFSLDEHYSMRNQIELTEQSLKTGWADLIQCHANLDAVAQLQIVYNAEHTRHIEILSQQSIDLAWVEGSSVQMQGLNRGAQICIYAQTLALQAHDQGYLLERGPFMRRFLDGYFPMHVELTINWPGLALQPKHILPVPQPGLVVTQSDQALSLNYWFQGQLRPHIYFNKPKPPG
ncbi:alpha/beta hydrolase [Thiomicrospira sp. R3]|uniref:alpha/beta fold hydrolase n=1 Tax=Thiomicrospira sp. R3 TaxID=3035472 RepID=UPI00259B265E|nr:alpha/beta hydrolase [Thiomicrospira sp. R3]WFE68201.1 alpha/beta hydrolase [Thiomicrospira sp. R3]